jgi:hypothetical protein
MRVAMFMMMVVVAVAVLEVRGRKIMSMGAVNDMGGYVAMDKGR